MKKNNRLILLSSILFIFTCFATFFTFSNTATAAYIDGEYSVPFQVLKDTSDEISATSDYIVSPAKISIENGKINAIVTLNNSSWWQEFKVQSSGSMNDVIVLSTNEEDDTKVVQLTIDDLNQPLHAHIHIIVTGIPGFEYDNRYDIRFQFDYSSIPTVVEGDEPEPETALPPKPDSESGNQSIKTDPTESPSSDEPIETNQEIETEDEKSEQQQEEYTEPNQSDVDYEEEGNQSLIDDSNREEDSAQSSLDLASEQSTEDSNTNNGSFILVILLVIGLLIGVFFMWKARGRKK